MSRRAVTDGGIYVYADNRHKITVSLRKSDVEWEDAEEWRKNVRNGKVRTESEGRRTKSGSG